MDRLFKTKTGHVILSVIWGLGIAALFYKVCQMNGGCYILSGNESSDYYGDDNFNGGCPKMYPDYEGGSLPRCHKPLFPHSPTMDHYQEVMPKNCGDARHTRDASCYKFNPMDSIFRAPSDQIYYKYH
jgi:hypothetical protein